MEINYRLKILQKDGYFTMEFQDPADSIWKEMVIRETKEEIINLMTPVMDDNDEQLIDEITGKPQTVFSPYYYEED